MKGESGTYAVLGTVQLLGGLPPGRSSGQHVTPGEPPLLWAVLRFIRVFRGHHFDTQHLAPFPWRSRNLFSSPRTPHAPPAECGGGRQAAKEAFAHPKDGDPPRSLRVGAGSGRPAALGEALTEGASLEVTFRPSWAGPLRGGAWPRRNSDSGLVSQQVGGASAAARPALCEPEVSLALSSWLSFHSAWSSGEGLSRGCGTRAPGGGGGGGGACGDSRGGRRREEEERGGGRHDDSGHCGPG